MRLRWLWGDYIEPGIEFSSIERKRIHRYLNASAHSLPHFWPNIGAMVLGGWAAVGFGGDPLGEWFDATFPQLGRAWAHGIAIFGICLGWVGVCIYFLGVLYVPVGRRCMCECGVRVCIKCGYDLRGQPPRDVTCPECGSLQPMITPTVGDDSHHDAQK